MPAPHPLAALWATPEPYRARARADVERTLRDALAAHGGDVRATAAALDPPVHEITLHKWIAAWGLDDARQGREREPPYPPPRHMRPAEKKSRGRKRTP